MVLEISQSLRWGVSSLSSCLRPGHYSGMKHAPALAALLPCLLLCACDHRVHLYGANNLRAELQHPANEYILKIDILILDSDYLKIKDRDVALYTQSCPPPKTNNVDYRDECITGVIDRSVPPTRQSDKIDSVTFEMYRTSVPGEIPGIMEKIRFVRLYASGPMILPDTYRSEPIAVH